MTGIILIFLLAVGLGIAAWVIKTVAFTLIVLGIVLLATVLWIIYNALS